MRRMLTVTLLAVLALPCLALAAEMDWPPKAPAGWVCMAQMGPTKVIDCTITGGMAVSPELKALCDGTANQTWISLFSNLTKFDPTTGSAPSRGITVFLDVSEDQYYFYCGDTLQDTFDPSAGFVRVDYNEIPHRVSACFR